MLQGGASQDFQRVSRKRSVHAVVWCASCTPLCCPGTLRPRQACSRLTSRFRVAEDTTPRRALRAGAAGPRRTLCSHDCQRAPRKLSVHAVVLCASCSPVYCPGASRPRQACSRLTSRFRVASYCRRVDLVCDKHGSTASAAAANTATTTIHSPTHRWLRQALRIQRRCTARPLFTRPAWPRRALR